MTFTEDFISVEDSGELRAPAPTYPTAFGVTFTPAIIGLTIGALGVAGSVYLLLCQLMPAWENYQKLQADLAQKQTQVQQKQAILKQIGKVNADLANAKQQQTEVLALFFPQKSNVP